MSIIRRDNEREVVSGVDKDGPAAHPNLTEAIRAGILAMVKAASGKEAPSYRL